MFSVKTPTFRLFYYEVTFYKPREFWFIFQALTIRSSEIARCISILWNVIWSWLTAHELKVLTETNLVILESYREKSCSVNITMVSLGEPRVLCALFSIQSQLPLSRFTRKTMSKKESYNEVNEFVKGSFWRSDLFMTVTQILLLVLCSRRAGYLSIETVLEHQSGNERREPNSAGMVTTALTRVWEAPLA